MIANVCNRELRLMFLNMLNYFPYTINYNISHHIIYFI